MKAIAINGPILRKSLRSILLLYVFFFQLTFEALGEGSGTWGTASDRRSWLWVPANSSSSNTGYGTRGFMMLPSRTSSSTYNSNYNPDHRFYVYVKAGETVFWGFRRNGGSGNIRVRWYYDQTDIGFYPVGTTGTGRVQISSYDYNPSGSGGASGRPANADDAAVGPSAIFGSSGYSARSFTNTTGADRAFWVEISTTSDALFSSGFNIDFWDVTVASGTSGNYSPIPGRVYCKYWSIVNGLPSVAGSNSNGLSFHDNFGFYVPVDNTFSGAPNDYFVKYANFGSSHGGYVNFFANQDGPRNNLTYIENRRSISGTSSNYQYPLFINDPDQTIWQTTDPPSASLEINYQEKPAPGTGGEAYVDLTISLPAIVDVLVDLNSNGVYDEGIDLIISENYDTPGTFQIYWNGEDAAGNELPNGSDIEFFAAVLFFPVHFPIYDMEQSLGITITNVRPGAVVQNAIYWDDSLLPRTGSNGINLATSAQSAAVNVTGEAGNSHIWWANGDNGISQNNTINTWAASYYTEVNEREGFNFLTIQGNVYDDPDGLEDNLVDGNPTSLQPLYAILINQATNKVRRVARVNSNGTFSLRKIPNGTYSILISTDSATLDANNPGVMLPSDWETTGENFGTGVGSDGVIDGVLTDLVVSGTSISNANFGIRPIIADLLVQKSVNNELPEFGSTVIFTITARNDGYNDAENVQVFESMPDGYTYLSHTVSIGTFNPASGIWDIGILTNGSTETLTLTCRVEETIEDYNNTVLITSTTPDPNLSNNSDNAETTPFRILPVTWLHLEANYLDPLAEISWITTNEKDLLYYQVERSKDGRFWEKVEMVEKTGNLAEKSEYRLLDRSPLPGRSYYRIGQVNQGEKISYSKVIALEKEPFQLIQAYPNPSSGVVRIELEDIENFQLLFVDSRGSKVNPKIINTGKTFYLVDLSTLPSGIYIAKAFNNFEFYSIRIEKLN
ncbi:hypothetical protein AO498_01720 [Algoriphagus sanaruensis]|uniref:Secretion system C-terminal sorting domain-containing protein n=1 Tax=Algoriphagus sanaruensis TaxID=1727163 RepID=A0A142EIY7_9BACT|nr:hypothetical protein AO498_01720 [Algoriphagus sanaruensis]